MFIIFVFLRFQEYNYKKVYSVNGFEVVERYYKNSKYYEFIIKDDKTVYPYQIKQNYNRKRELISIIEIFEKEDETCILPKSSSINFFPLCSKNNEVYTYNLTSITDVAFNYKKAMLKKETYKSVDINFLNDSSYLIYNYRGFYLINKEKTKEIELFKDDIYTLDLAYQKDNYLIVPNYNQNYFFNTFFIIDINNGKVEEVKFDYEISFESEFLGEFKNNIYLIDKKSEKQYKIDIRKEIIEEVPLQLIRNGKLNKVTFQTIVNNNYKFSSSETVNYKIIDNYLYRIVNNYKIKISDKEIDKIIKYENDNVYYLYNENLYMYNNLYGEVKLLSNFEWNFNNTNVIYFSK